ncbi:MAG: hypothetical protein VB050_15155 [Geobacteraceae bacterium]|nr:hypothetical protein [Geobacteraceae bacterium]
MGRLKGLASGVIMVLLVVIIEFLGYRIDTVCSDSTPEIIGFVTFATLLAASFFLKANRIAVLTVLMASAVYGIIAYMSRLGFYYHDYPESLSIFTPTIVSRSILYALPVFIGYVIVAIRTKRRVRSRKSQQ